MRNHTRVTRILTSTHGSIWSESKKALWRKRFSPRNPRIRTLPTIRRCKSKSKMTGVRPRKYQSTYRKRQGNVNWKMMNFQSELVTSYLSSPPSGTRPILCTTTCLGSMRSLRKKLAMKLFQTCIRTMVYWMGPSLKTRWAAIGQHLVSTTRR